MVAIIDGANKDMVHKYHDYEGSFYASTSTQLLAILALPLAVKSTCSLAKSGPELLSTSASVPGSMSDRSSSVNVPDTGLDWSSEPDKEDSGAASRSLRLVFNDDAFLEALGRVIGGSRI